MNEPSAAYQLGQFFGYFIPLAAGVAASLYLRKKRGGDKMPGWPIIIGLVVSLLACVGSPSKGDQRQDGQPIEAAASDELEVQQNVIGPASKFDPNFLPSQLRDYESRMQMETAENLRRNGINVRTTDVNVTSIPEQVGSNRIVKTVIQIPTQAFLYQFAGISGPQFVVVVCRMTSDRPFELKGSDCEKRVKDVFGKAV